MGSEFCVVMEDEFRRASDFCMKVTLFIDSCRVDESFKEKAPAHYDYANLHQFSLLSRAVARGKRGMVKWLLRKGADPNDKRDVSVCGAVCDFSTHSGLWCQSGQTSLIRYAVTTKRDGISIPEMLLNSGAEVDAVTRSGATALHYCAAGGLLKVARLLIGRGATVDIKDTAGYTPLDYCQAAADKELRCLLMDSRTSQLFSKVVAGGLVSSMSFLCEGVYDPRLLIHIANFAFVEDVVNKRKF